MACRHDSTLDKPESDHSDGPVHSETIQWMGRYKCLCSATRLVWKGRSVTVSRLRFLFRLLASTGEILECWLFTLSRMEAASQLSTGSARLDAISSSCRHADPAQLVGLSNVQVPCIQIRPTENVYQQYLVDRRSPLGVPCLARVCGTVSISID
jgi:hypothetical protein